MNRPFARAIGFLSLQWLPGIFLATMLLGGCTTTSQVTFDTYSTRSDTLGLARMNNRLADRFVIVRQVGGEEVRGTFQRCSEDSCYLLIDDRANDPIVLANRDIESLQYKDHWGGLVLGFFAGLGTIIVCGLLGSLAYSRDAGVAVLIALGGVLFGFIGAPIIGGVNGVTNTLLFPCDSRSVGHRCDDRPLLDAMMHEQAAYYKSKWRPHAPSTTLLKAWDRHRGKLLHAIPEESAVLRADTVMLFESVNYAGDIAGRLTGSRGTYAYWYEHGDSLVVHELKEPGEWSFPFFSSQIVEAAARLDVDAIYRMKPGPERLDEGVSRVHVFRLINQYTHWHVRYFEYTDFPNLTIIQ